MNRKPFAIVTGDKNLKEQSSAESEKGISTIFITFMIIAYVSNTENLPGKHA